jgi:dienelactone hydrolase
MALAESGFAVVAIDHPKTGNPATTIFPNGDIVTCSVSTIMFSDVSWETRFDLRILDMKAAIEELKKINISSFDNKLDLESIGSFGQSNGGATSAYALSKIPEIKAAVNLDGSLFTDQLSYTETSKPYLIIAQFDQSDLDAKGNASIESDLINSSLLNGTTINLNTYDHLDFTDIRSLEKFLDFKLVNSEVDPSEGSQSLQKELIKFFSQTLKH